MARVPEGAAGRELYALVERPFHSLTEAEWCQWQARWRDLFDRTPIPCGVPHDHPPGSF